jgi:hypothetical protein
MQKTPKYINGAKVLIVKKSRLLERTIKAIKVVDTKIKLSDL